MNGARSTAPITSAHLAGILPASSATKRSVILTGLVIGVVCRVCVVVFQLPGVFALAVIMGLLPLRRVWAVHHSIPRMGRRLGQVEGDAWHEDVVKVAGVSRGIR